MLWKNESFIGKNWDNWFLWFSELKYVITKPILKAKKQPKNPIKLPKWNSTAIATDNQQAHVLLVIHHALPSETTWQQLYILPHLITERPTLSFSFHIHFYGSHGKKSLCFQSAARAPRLVRQVPEGCDIPHRQASSASDIPAGMQSKS